MLLVPFEPRRVGARIGGIDDVQRGGERGRGVPWRGVGRPVAYSGEEAESAVPADRVGVLAQVDAADELDGRCEHVVVAGPRELQCTTAKPAIFRL